MEIVTFCRQPKAKLPVVHLLVYSSIDKTAFSHSSYKEVNMLSALKQSSDPQLASPWDDRKMEGLCFPFPVIFFSSVLNPLLNPCSATLWNSPCQLVHDT